MKHSNRAKSVKRTNTRSTPRVSSSPAHSTLRSISTISPSAKTSTGAVHPQTSSFGRAMSPTHTSRGSQGSTAATRRALSASFASQAENAQEQGQKPMPTEILQQGGSIYDYLDQTPHVQRFPELELYTIKSQHDAMDRILQGMTPKLTAEEQNELIIRQLKMKAQRLHDEYGNLPTQQAADIEYSHVNSKLQTIGSDLSSSNPASSMHGVTLTPETSSYIDKHIHEEFATKYSQNTQLDPETGKPLSAAQRKRLKDGKRAPKWVQTLSAHYTLTKPRISMLVAMTSIWGYAATTHHIDWKALALVTTGTLGLSAAASIINQIREIDVDGKMPRTSGRPLVRGTISVERAKQAATAYALAGITCLTPLNPMAAILGILNIGLYGGVYTSLKRTSKLNTEVGAIVGAIPPIMGYFAALKTLGPDATWDANLTALLYPAGMMFSWQMQHVMLICMLRSDEYNKSGLMMQCYNDPELKSTRRKGIVWAWLSTLLTVAPYFSGYSNLTQLFATYLWGVYSAFYTNAAMTMNPKKLRTVLLAGYALLLLTFGLHVHSHFPDDPFSHLILSSPNVDALINQHEASKLVEDAADSGV